MAALLGPDDLPGSFSYPPLFLRVVGLGLTDLEPWLVLEGEALFSRHRGLRERFPAQALVPFARRIDNDDVACWDVAEEDSPVVLVHDFASSGWERRRVIGSVAEWLRLAVDDLIEFE